MYYLKKIEDNNIFYIKYRNFYIKSIYLFYNNFLELLYFQGKSKRNKRIHVFIYNLPYLQFLKIKNENCI